jgi:transcriptional regulator with XRE-family HTH domain
MSLPSNQVTFGSQLRKHRREAGLTQEALASRSGVSLRAIQQIETDRAAPRRATAGLLADALDLSGAARDEFLRLAAPVRRRPASSSSAGGAGRRMAARIVSIRRLSPGDGAGPDEERGDLLVAHRRSTPNNIPHALSDLLGREADLISIRRLIVVDNRRLVTLLAGGTGPDCQPDAGSSDGGRGARRSGERGRANP